MRIDIATLFPELCEHYLSQSIIGRARTAGHVEITCHNIRDYSDNKHKKVDEIPYGGGRGMVMTPEPIFRCFQAVTETLSCRPTVIYLSPKGKVLNQSLSGELSKRSNLFLLCGHYEGVDQRVLDEIVDMEISIGDFVLTGGELPALVLCDSIVRLCDNVLADKSCYEDESHFGGLLEYPHYTRPPVWHDKEVPPVLLSGHHANINAWRKEQAEKLTLERRPDLLSDK